MSSILPRHALRTGLVTLLMLAASGGVSLSAPPIETLDALGGAMPVQATEATIGANDLETITEIARGYGEAELTTVDNGDPVIVGEMNAISYQLFFLDCTANRDCRVLDFYAIWDTPGVELAVVNDWNRTQPFHKAYLGEDGLPVIELNLSTVGGMTRAQLVDAFDRWAVALAEFQRSVVEAAL